MHLKLKACEFIVPRSGLVTTMTGKLSLFITSDIKQSLLMGTNKPPEPSVITISHSFQVLYNLVQFYPG